MHNTHIAGASCRASVRRVASGVDVPDTFNPTSKDNT